MIGKSESRDISSGNNHREYRSVFLTTGCEVTSIRRCASLSESAAQVLDAISADARSTHGHYLACTSTRESAHSENELVPDSSAGMPF